MRVANGWVKTQPRLASRVRMVPSGCLPRTPGSAAEPGGGSACDEVGQYGGGVSLQTEGECQRRGGRCGSWCNSSQERAGLFEAVGGEGWSRIVAALARLKSAAHACCQIRPAQEGAGQDAEVFDCVEEIEVVVGK